MRQHQWMVLGGAIALITAGCASETPPPAAQSPEATASPTAEASPAPATKPFTTTKPLVAQKPAAPGTVTGLIQSTNPDERARQVQADIQARQKQKTPARDPFGGVPPKLPKPPAAATPSKVPTVTTLPSGAKPGVPSKPFTPPKPPIATKPTPPPPPPSTTLASAVEVTGIVQIGGESYAIVKAPDEPTTRYVKAQQRIANGQVLVKRIDLNRGPEPVVILEENGVEVARAVGEKSVQPQAIATPKPA